MGKYKTPIPFAFLDGNKMSPENGVRRIDPSSKEGRRIEKEILGELPPSFGNTGKKWYVPSHLYPRRTKDPTIKAWGEEKLLSSWLEDPRCICKSRKALLMRLKSNWAPERAFSTRYDGIFVV